MFTFRNSKKTVRVLFRQPLASIDRMSTLRELSKDIPEEEMVSGTIESIVYRVMKSLYGVGNIELKSLIHHVANMVTRELEGNDLKLFLSINNDGNLKSTGLQDDEMRRVFERLSPKIQFLSIIIQK